jgi:hypothetical protein
MALVAAVCLVGGCASAGRIERTAEANEQRAREYQAKGDTKHAAEKQALAAKQWDKARQRQVWEDVMPVVFY